jgi:ADP-ribose pyrophosphatase
MEHHLTDRLLYDAGFLKLVSARVAFSGTTIERVVVRHPGAVVVVPITDSGNVVLIRQFRAAVTDWVIELPAGKRDVAGEDPRETARRELAEECGLTASEVVHLGSFYNSPGFTDELTQLYLARGLGLVGRSPQSVEENESSIVSAAIDSIGKLLSNGTLIDAKTIVGLCMAQEFLDNEGLSEKGPTDLDDVSAVIDSQLV